MEETNAMEVDWNEDDFTEIRKLTMEIPWKAHSASDQNNVVTTHGKRTGLERTLWRKHNAK